MAISSNEEAENIRDADDQLAMDTAKAALTELNPSVTYGKWKSFPLTDGMRGLWADYGDSTKQTPFSNMIIGGDDIQWKDDGSFYMIDDDVWWSKSSYFKATLKSGWQVRLDVKTENNNYINLQLNTDLASKDYLNYDYEPTDSDWNMWQDAMNFTMFKVGDGLSIDIDNESSTVGQFTVIVGGVRYTVAKPDNMDDEAKVYVGAVWYWQANAITETYTGEITINEDPLPPCNAGYMRDPITQQCVLIQGGGGGGGGDETVVEDSSILLIVGGVAIIVAASFFILRGE
jgi:hypothetical protein